MADEIKISGLQAVVTPATTDYFPVVQGGVTKRETIEQALSLISFIQENSKYVSTGGSDITGDGSILRPYLTIQFAIDQISDATSIKRYVINAMPGIYDEDILIKPYISIFSEGFLTTSVRSIVLGTGWATGGDFQATGIKINNEVNIDFSVDAPPTANVGFFSSHLNGNINFTGSIGNQNILFLTNTIPQQQVNVKSATALINGCSEFGDLSVSSAASDGDSLVITFGSLFTGNISASNTGANTTQLIQTGCTIFGGITLDGANTLWTPDVSSFKEPTILNSATYTLSSIGSGVTANFTPVNYTPIDTSVTGNLKGIDAALAAAGEFSNFEIVWADPNGDDSTGDGSFNNPYQTIMFAQSTILDASSSKLYMVVWTGVTATIDTPFLKPFIFWTAFNNFALNPFCPIIVTNPITLDASFSGIASVTGLIGFYFYNASTVMDFDMTGMAGGTTVNIQLERVRPYAEIVATNVAGSTLGINAKYCDLQVLTMNGGFLTTQNCSIGNTTLNGNSTVGVMQHNSTNDFFISLYSLIGTDNQQVRSDIHNASWPINQFTNTNIPPVLRGTNTHIFSDAQSYIFPNLLDTVSVDGSSFSVRGYNNTNKKIFQQEGFQFYDDVMGASTVNLNATYNNGTAGSGATLTNAGSFAAFNIDGVNTYTTIEVGMRFLIKNQTSAFQNGIYVLTTLGNGVSINWVLTRADDLNSAGAVIENYLTLIYFGDINSNSYYRVDAAIATMGTDAIDFSLLDFFDVFGASTGTINKVVLRKITSDGTYTPTAGMLYCEVEVVGGGAGGGGASATSAVQGAVGGAGGGGGYAVKIFSAATIGASQSVTIGAGGTAGTTAPTDGGDGGETSFGSLLSATGGQGGIGNNSVVGRGIPGTPGGVGSSGTININGTPGGSSLSVGLITVAGAGGSSYFGGGGEGIFGVGTGQDGRSYGGGGSGAVSQDSAAQAGGAGFPGIVVIREYCS